MLIDDTLKEIQQAAYLRGWQDAAEVITKTFEVSLRSTIESITIPNFGDEDDNKKKSQSKGSDV